jgi:hypothetical protein
MTGCPNPRHGGFDAEPIAAAQLQVPLLGSSSSVPSARHRLCDPLPPVGYHAGLRAGVSRNGVSQLVGLAGVAGIGNPGHGDLTRHTLTVQLLRSRTALVAVVVPGPALCLFSLDTHGLVVWGGRYLHRPGR